MASRPKIAAAIIFLIASKSALPANGFVSGTNVSRVGDLAAVSIALNCQVRYLGHDPQGRADQLRVHIEPTSVCTGVPPTAALTNERHRPASADLAKLIDIEYIGDSPGNSMLQLNFSEEVGFGVDPFTTTNYVVIRVNLNPDQPEAAQGGVSRVSRRVQRPAPEPVHYVINLQSSLRPPATADYPDFELPEGQQLLISEAIIDGKTWYRLRVGYFASSAAAAQALATLRADFPTAWIDRDDSGTRQADTALTVPSPIPDERSGGELPAIDAATDEKVVELMAEGRRLMTAGELSRAVQIYTKVLQQPASQYQPEAQEFLALARERNGQIAHAKAEYQRYLDTYPEHDGAKRVKQRLAALLSQPGARQAATTAAAGRSPDVRRRQPETWSFRSYVSQYYRRDANQLNDNDEVISQSALYTDVNFDARRRGERFDFSARVTGGYRKDFLDQPRGDDIRMSYAFVDLADAKYSLRGRLGRQSRNSGGVLGRFDGLNLSYQATDYLRVDAVAGKPVNSTSDGIDGDRTFYGISSNLTPGIENLDVGVFFLQQNVADLTDRQSVGAEARYFGDNKSIWGLIDFDTSFSEISSLFLQGSWRLESGLTLTAFLDRRRSPLLSLSNALIGQPVAEFDELLILYPEDEIHQMALDRAAMTTSMTVGASRPLSPKFQLNLNATQSAVEATPESGGVFATPETTYTYVSTDLVGSSLIKEGDVSLLGLRYSDSESTQVYSTYLDTRFPIGKYFRINPRIRVDNRLIKSDDSTQWIYTPGIRLQYRKDRRFRVDFEAGMQFSSRETVTIDEDRESYFINLGYQFLF